MQAGGRPRLATLATIKDALSRSTSERTRAQRLRIISRHPDRYANISLDQWSVDVAWCTPRPGRDRIAYTADAVVQDVQDNVTKATAYLLDVLDVLGPTSDDIARWLLRLDESCASPEVDVYILLDRAMHSDHDIARWSSIVPLLTLQPEQTITADTKGQDASSSAHHAVATYDDDSADSDQLRHLTRLPVGFSADALRRRILQWRRMGFDVSDLESALVQNDEEREHTYRHVEADVRRAIDLDRQLTEFGGHLTATEIEHFRFRLRQLTGLDDVAAKLSSERI